MRTPTRLLVSLATIAVAVLLSAPLVLAASKPVSAVKSPSDSQSISKAPVTQAYAADTAVQLGMIVRLGAKDSSKVGPLRYDDSKNMLGVVVSANQSPLTLSGTQKQATVYVATYGKYAVLVSNQNGAIQPGDYVSISNIDGVGMRADGEEKTVIGKALAGFDGKSDVQGSATLTKSDGSKTQVSLGRITVQVLVQPNPLQSVGLPTAFTNLLSRVGYSVSNKTVNPARLYLALVLFVVAAFIAGILLFGGVRTAMTAIGRNPLARKAIYRSLIQVVMSSLIIFLLGIFAVYLLLKL